MIYFALVFLISSALGIEDISNINEAKSFLNKYTQMHRFLAFCFKRSASCSAFKKSLKISEEKSEEIIIGYYETSEDDKDYKELEETFTINTLPHIVCSLKDKTEHFVYLESIDPNEIRTITERMNNYILEYKTIEKFEEDKKNVIYHEGLVLGLFSNEDIKARDNFISLASSAKQYYRFSYTNSNSEIAKKHDLTEGVILLRPSILEYEKSQNKIIIENIKNIDELANEINKKFYGKIAWLTPFTESLLFGNEKNLIILFIKEGTNILPDIVAPLSSFGIDFEKYRIAIARQIDYSWLLAEHGYSDKDLPLLAIQNKDHLYIYEKENVNFNDEILKFIKFFEKGEILPSLKSEMPKPDEDGIINYVSKTLTMHISDPKNKIFLLVYSDDCKSCEASKLFMKKLKEKNQNNVKIGQINADYNEMPCGIKPNYLPAFYLITNSKCSEQIYDNGFSIEVVNTLIANEKNDL